MKKILLIFILALLLPSCDKDSGGGSDTSFKAKPNDLTNKKFNSPVPGDPINGTRYTVGTHTGNYAILYSGIIDSTNYIGIACSDSPDPELGNETYNLKIYFPATSIPNGTVNINPIIKELDIPGTATITQFNVHSTTDTTNYIYTIYEILGTSSFGNISIYAVHGVAK